MTGQLATDADFDQLPPVVDPSEAPPITRIGSWLGALEEEPPHDVALVGERPPYPEPEDRSTAVLSELGEVEYVTDLIRPGRIHVWAAEEGSGKTFAVDGELAIRIAVAGGSFAETWPVARQGPVLVLSEMHSDDDYRYESTVLESLGLERSALAGRYYRLSLMTAAGGPPVLTVGEWRSWLVEWMQAHDIVLLVIDTATGASQVDPWGQAIQAVYRDLRAMIERYPPLAVALVLHLKKPQGHGERRISDVLGEWGRWCDVVILQESDGKTRTKLSTHKRVRTQRRIIATKAGGLLVEAIDADSGHETKVALEDVVAAVAARPGMTLRELGEVLEVSKDTAANYVKAAEAKGLLIALARGPKRQNLVYAADEVVEPSDEPPKTAEQTAFGDASAVEDIDQSEGTAERRTPIYSSAVPSSVVEAATPDAPVATFRCSDYSAHQSQHRRDGDGWICDACVSEWML